MNSNLTIIPQRHCIQKQIIEIAVPGIENAMSIQNEVRRICYDKLMPRLQILFDEYSHPGTVLKIDKLEIDIRHISAGKIQEELVEKAIRSIQAQLNDLKIKVAETGAKENVSVQQTQLAELDAFINFIETGILPWSSDVKDGRKYEENLAVIFKSHSGIAAHRILELFEMNEDAIQRCVYQFTGSFLEVLVEMVVPGKKDKIISLLSLLKDFLISSKRVYISQKELAYLLWLQVFKAIVLFQKTANDEIEKHIISESVLSFSGHANYKAEFINGIYEEAKLIAVHEKSFEIIKNTLAELKDKNNKHVKDPNYPDNLLLSAEDQKGFENIINDNEWDTTQAKKSNKEKRLRRKQQPGDNLEIYIENAGLVILHPFLHEFFREMKLVNDAGFVDQESRHRAAHLLQYMVTADNIHPEYDLALNKIICGIPLNEPIEREIVIRENEMEEAANLLKAVIRHWSILKNTSVEGLRNNFLKRQGKITTKDDNNWLIQAEQKPFDIIMSHLPWSLSIIKLPWLMEMIYVEW